MRIVLVTLSFRDGLLEVFDSRRSSDQAGFRLGRSTADRFFTLSILQETEDEWRMPSWAATSDFKKAFDSAREHLGGAYRTRVQRPYVSLFEKLYFIRSGSSPQ